MKLYINKPAGMIVNFFSEQLLKRDFKVSSIPVENYTKYFSENNIDIVFIDNSIYECNHPWFSKEMKSLLYYLEKKQIKVIVIKNTSEQINQLFEGLFIWEIGRKKKITYSNNHLSTPILINEYLYNPIDRKKSIDLLLVKFDSSTLLNNEFDINKSVVGEILIDKVTNEKLHELISKIQQSKIIVLDYNQEIDNIFILYLDAIAKLSNSIFILEEKYNITEKRFLEFNNQENKNYIKALLKSDIFMHKNCISQSRKKFIENTLINKQPMYKLLEGDVHCDKVEISVITSSIRKNKLNDYIEQLNRQKFVNLEVILLTHNYILTHEEKEKFKNISNFKLIIIEADRSLSLGGCLNKCLKYASKPFVTKMDDDDFYYANYLMDLWIAKQYSKADVVGKGAHFVYLKSHEILMLRHMNNQYKFVEHVIGGSLFCESKLLKEYQFSDVSIGEDSDFYKRIISDNKTVYATHPYETCLYRSESNIQHTWKIREIELIGSSKIVSYGSPGKYLEIE